MDNGIFLFADRIKSLRERSGLTQAELAKKLGLTRSCINAWEMGLSVASTVMVVELARFFHVTTDYLLGVSSENIIRTDSLSERQIAAIRAIVDCFEE